MQLVTAEEVHRLLNYHYLIEALRQAHLGAPPFGAHIVADDPAGSGNQFVSLLGWKGGGAIAAKLVGVFPGNLKRDPPQASVQGIVAVFDANTGAPRLVTDGEAMTFRKTAADSGLGAAFLARHDAEVLLVVGAGGLAPHVIAAHRAVRPSLSRVMIWNRTPARAEALRARLLHDGVAAEVVADLDAAVAEADVISCVTMSRAPLVKGALLKPGAHLDLVGAYLPEMRECDDTCVTRGTLFVDTRGGMENAGDLCQPVAAGVIGWEAVRADHYELAQGTHPGRRNDEEITVCKNVGGGHLDLFTAQALMGRLESRE